MLTLSPGTYRLEGVSKNKGVAAIGVKLYKPKTTEQIPKKGPAPEPAGPPPHPGPESAAGQPESVEPGPALESIPPQEIHRLLPENVLEARLVETKDERKWGMFTRRYGATSPESSILVMINKNYQAKEEITPAIYKKLIAQLKSEIDRQGFTIKYYDDYPVTIEKNQPGNHIAGGFAFSWFTCSIQCTGSYARPECFDAAVRSVLSKLSYASAAVPAVAPAKPTALTPAPVREPAKLAIRAVSPKALELLETRNVTIEVNVFNYGSSPAEKVEAKIIDSNGETLNYCNLGVIETDKGKTVQMSFEIKITPELASRLLAVKVTAANAENVADSVEVKGRRPASLSIVVEPSEIIITPDKGGSANPKVILKNSGDLPAENLTVQCELVGTKYISKEDECSVGANGTKSITPRGCGDVLNQYGKDNQVLPAENKVRIVLRKRGGGEIIGEAFVVYRREGFTSKLGLEIANKEVTCDLTPKQGDEETFQSPQEGICLGSPFGISVANRGSISAENVRVEIWEKLGVAAYAAIPRISPAHTEIDHRPSTADIKKIPEGRDFVKLVSAREGRNKYDVVLSENGKEAAREQVCLIVKGLEPEKQPGKTYTDKRFELQGKVRLGAREILVYEGDIMGKDAIRKAYLLAVDPDGTLVKDPLLARRAGRVIMLYNRHLGDQAFKLNRQQQQNVNDFLTLEAAAQLALFFRDAAGVALADVGVMYLTGNTAKISQTAAKKIAKNALKSATESIVKNPDNYLRAIAIKLCKDNQNGLAELEKELQAEKGRVPAEEKMNALEEKSTELYSRIVPSFDLIKSLDPDADVLGQLKDVAGTMKDEVLNIFPGGIGKIRPEEAATLYQKFGDTVDAIYSRYTKYAGYKQAVKDYREEMARGPGGLEEREQLVNEKVDNGLILMKDYTIFSPK